MDTENKFGFAGRLATYLIDSKLTPIMVIASILLGVFAVLMLPREEEPQIKVPMIDVMVAMPGASASEVENRVTRPMEQLLWEVSGVEYLYSTSNPGNSMVTVRFKVGSDLEAALVRLNQKLQTNFDRIPMGVSEPLIKPRTIDDVPIYSLTFHGRDADHWTLRQMAVQVANEIKNIDQVAETTVIGGLQRMIRVQFDLPALAARGLTVMEMVPRLQQANRQIPAGSRPFQGQEVLLETGLFLRDADDVGAVVVGVHDGRPVYLREVAVISDTASEPVNYVLHGVGGAEAGEPVAAVTLSVAKRPGANAIAVVNRIEERVASLRGDLIPAGIETTVTRDYGHTAADKSNELLLHMGMAVLGVTILIFLFLGWRESLVILLAIPSTLALTLLVFYLYGFTLNRITLFALIFSIGILVDDAIVVVENIVRHMRLPGARKKPLIQVALEAVDEVGNPTILATWAVIAAILPMAFVGGLMGPYMRPIPVGATAAMLFSLIIAFTITPWAAVRVLGRHFKSDVDASSESVNEHDVDTAPNDFFTRIYHRVMDPLLDRPVVRWAFLGSIVFLLLAAMGLVAIGAVKVKMLPFDNKSEFQIIIKTEEGTTLEDTTQVALEIAAALREEPEVKDFQIYAGTAAPFNFNGLVRHYFLRSGPNVADIQVNLVDKGDRKLQSHDIAVRVRPSIAAIAEKHGASVAVAEVPPGPPVLQTVVAEIYGPDEAQRVALAREVRRIMGETPGVVDIDWHVEAPQPKVRYIVDKEKAALHGISEQDIAQALQLASQHYAVDLLHRPDALEDIFISFELSAADRRTPSTLLEMEVRSSYYPDAQPIALSELVSLKETTRERSLYRKNLKPVTYVTADLAGEIESPAYALLIMNRQLRDLDAREFGGSGEDLAVYNFRLPFDDREPALKWDGEWHITLEVFRDLGLAFAVVLILITMLMVGWFRSYVTPLVVMAAIPFSLIGILPAHWAMGAFFTATSMIGFMAGAGIVVRNSIILVDFIELRRSHGKNLRDAVVEAGAVRFRPMLLTALALVVGASVILADPIFQGLAISLMFGEIASLLISRMAVPVLYYMAAK